MARRAASFVVLAVLGAGCAQPLPDRAVVDDLRVLGVRAEPPEARPGTTVSFDALVADPTGEGRSLSRVWAICNPGDGGIGSCGDPANVLALGTGLTATWTVPGDALEGLDPPSALAGRDVYVVLGVEVAGVDDLSVEVPHDVAFKRVRVSTNGAPNANPVLAELTVGGSAAQEAPLSVASAVELELVARPSSGSQESYFLPGGTQAVEEARYTWLVTAGSVGDAVSYGETDGVGRTRWRLPEGAAAATMWVVLRDGRGGTSWASQRVVVQD